MESTAANPMLVAAESYLALVKYQISGDRGKIDLCVPLIPSSGGVV